MVLTALESESSCLHSHTLPRLLATPGASSHVIFAEVPYSRAALRSFLSRGSGHSDGLCSRETAREMAKVSPHPSFCAHVLLQEAYRRSLSLLLEEERSWAALARSNVFGVACTAALFSLAPKRGAHRCHVASVGSNGTRLLAVELVKGLRSREEEDGVCSSLVLRAIAEAALPQQQESSFLQEVISKSKLSALTLTDREPVLADSFEAEDDFLRLAGSRNVSVFHLEGGRVLADLSLPARTLVYSGSFNPLHQGHTELVAAVSRLVGGFGESESAPLVVFEISATNVDKPSLAKTELLRRIQQFTQKSEPISRSRLQNLAVCVTNAPLFVEKARLFPQCSFIIGADTLSRLLNPKYYGDSMPNLIRAMDTIRELGCDFFVGGRKGETGFVTADSLLRGASLPPEILGMFHTLSEDDFRVDISSTELRARAAEQCRNPKI